MSTRAAAEIHSPEFEGARDGETPETLLESAERSEILRHALSSLKAEYREVLLLREEEGMSYADIARVTGDSESSVKSRLFKARRALAAMLSPRLGERSLR
jgi:RNA polymerase sigma-70 factor (ECF subfamily)